MSDIETMRDMFKRAGVEFYDEDAEYSPTRRLEPGERGIWIRRDDIWITWFFGPDGNLKSLEVSEMRDRTDD